MQDILLLGVVLLLAAFGFYVMDRFDVFWESVRPNIGKNIILTVEPAVLSGGLTGVAELDKNTAAAGSRNNDENYKLLKDVLKSICLMVATTGLGLLFQKAGLTDANIITIYILSVLINSVITSNRIYEIVYSLACVMIFNYFFTVPRYTFLAYDQGYPVTFLVMLIASLMTGTLAEKLKRTARQYAESAYRTRILFETNQVLGKAAGSEEITETVANQLIKLLGKDVIVYLADEEKLLIPQIYPVSPETDQGIYLSTEEKKVAQWVFGHNRQAGATTEIYPQAACLYYSVRVNEKVYGVIGVAIPKEPLDTFENSILLSILGEYALALENDKILREKEAVALRAQNERLRANLLRSISHDLRTPLTSISGNASILMSDGDHFDEETKHQLYTDIYDDSIWLIELVENLLAISKIEDNHMNMQFTTEVLDEVLMAALEHVDRRKSEHRMVVNNSDELLLIKMDARLIVQVIINVVNNAIKYTQQGSVITISTEKQGDKAIIQIADNGPGIPDDMKQHVFEMFYSGAKNIADSRRSLGLGLSLCMAIVTAHGGELELTDNIPHGAVFTFTLPTEEVDLHE